jgi:hypothetical protein
MAADKPLETTAEFPPIPTTERVQPLPVTASLGIAAFPRRESAREGVKVGFSIVEASAPGNRSGGLEEFAQRVEVEVAGNRQLRALKCDALSPGFQPNRLAMQASELIRYIVERQCFARKFVGAAASKGRQRRV